jgi:hypothetical protein
VALRMGVGAGTDIWSFFLCERLPAIMRFVGVAPGVGRGIGVAGAGGRGVAVEPAMARWASKSDR